LSKKRANEEKAKSKKRQKKINEGGKSIKKERIGGLSTQPPTKKTWEGERTIPKAKNPLIVRGRKSLTERTDRGLGKKNPKQKFWPNLRNNKACTEATPGNDVTATVQRG